MNRKTIVSLAASALLTCSSAFVFAQEPVVPKFDVAKVIVEQDQIRADAQAGKGRYRTLEESDRLRLFRQQDELLAMLGNRTYEELSVDQRMTAFNSLETISAIVNSEGDQRMVCERVKPIGSNRVERVCMTVAQRELARQRTLDDLQRQGAQSR